MSQYPIYLFFKVKRFHIFKIIILQGEDENQKCEEEERISKEFNTLRSENSALKTALRRQWDKGGDNEIKGGDFLNIYDCMLYFDVFIYLVLFKLYHNTVY